MSETVKARTFEISMIEKFFIFLMGLFCVGTYMMLGQIDEYSLRLKDLYNPEFSLANEKSGYIWP